MDVRIRYSTSDKQPLFTAADGDGLRFVTFLPIKSGTQLDILSSNSNCKFSAIYLGIA